MLISFLVCFTSNFYSLHLISKTVITWFQPIFPTLSAITPNSKLDSMLYSFVYASPTICNTFLHLVYQILFNQSPKNWFQLCCEAWCWESLLMWKFHGQFSQIILFYKLTFWSLIYIILVLIFYFQLLRWVRYRVKHFMCIVSLNSLIISIFHMKKKLRQVW